MAACILRRALAFFAGRCVLDRGAMLDDDDGEHVAAVQRLEALRQLYTPLRVRWEQGDRSVAPCERWAPLLTAVGGPSAWETIARGLSTLEEYELALASADLGVRL